MLIVQFLSPKKCMKENEGFWEESDLSFHYVDILNFYFANG